MAEHDETVGVWPLIHTLLVQFAPRIAVAEAATTYDERIAIINGVSAHIAGKVDERIAAMGEGWQDIASAPRDREVLIAYTAANGKRAVQIGRWDKVDMSWRATVRLLTKTMELTAATHWAHVPPPPGEKP
jgi:hypothetical protein